MQAHRRRTTTSLGLLAVVFLVLAVVTSDRGPAVGALHAQTSWRGPGDRTGATLLALRRGRLPLPAVGRGPDRRRAGRGLRSVHGALVREPVRDGHRARGGSLRGARQRPVRGGRGDPAALRDRPAEPHPGGSAREPLREGRPRRGRVAAGAEPLLVRGPGDRGPAAVRLDRRPTGGGRAGPGAGGLRVDRVDHVRTPRSPRSGAARGPRSRGDRRVGRTMGTAASAARRREPTGSRPCRGTIPRIRSCETGTATAWCASPAAGARRRRDRRRRRARPGPGAGRTATAPRCGATIPTASRAATARISGAWTATTTAGPANGEGGGRPPAAGRTPRARGEAGAAAGRARGVPAAAPLDCPGREDQFGWLSPAE